MEHTVTAAIRSIWHASHTQGLGFPETVKQLMALGVQRYHVDYTGRTVTAYIGANADVSPLEVDVGPVDGSKTWNVEGVKATIASVQRGELKYQAFSQGVVDHGVTGYYVYMASGRSQSPYLT